MENVASILVVLEGTAADTDLVSKAALLARRCGAGLELFLCDAKRAYSLRQAFDPTGIEASRQDCVLRSREYLEGLRLASPCSDLRVSIDAACASPLYEAIVSKVRQCRPQLVMKNAAGAHHLRRVAWEANDWQLMRACPVTLLLSRGKSWRERPTFAAAIDVSEQETEGLARSILETSMCLVPDTTQLDVIYGERSDGPTAASERRRAELQRLTAAVHVDVGRIHVLPGAPEQVLPLFAAGRDYDVLVMGALTHRSGLAPLVGTLTSRLVEALDCDFVLVKPNSQPQANRVDSTGEHFARADDETETVPRLGKSDRLSLLSPW